MGSAPKVTPREAEVLTALAERLTNAEIADQLYLSERTVESHVSSLLRKFAAANRIELAELARSRSAEDVGRLRPLPAPVELLVDPAGFCGRDAERFRLRAMWERATSGLLLMGIVSGEAGIGKSRLVAELAAEAHRAGAQVWLGADLQDSGRPFEPLIQAIAADAAFVDDEELRRRVGAGAEALARIIPELAVRLSIEHERIVFDPVSARTDAYAAIHGYLCRAAEFAPVLLVVEDAHWATTTTLGALSYIAAIGGRAPVLVLVTTRDVAPDLGTELETYLSEMSRVAAVERVVLNGLALAEVADLLTHLGGGADPQTTTADTGGNPLFVREVAQSDGGVARGSLAALLRRREALLGTEASRLLDLAAVFGPSFDADLLASAIAAPLAEVLELLEAGEAAGWIVHAPGERSRFSFVHALFQAARYDTIAPSQRLRMHAAVVAALAGRGDESRVAPDLARHACAAVPLVDARAAIDYAARAAALAEGALAFDEAASHYRRALDVADRLEPHDARIRLRLSTRLGEVMQGAGQPGYEPILIEAAQAARELGDAQALAEVGWAMVKYGGPRHPNRDAQFVAIAQEALNELGPAPTAARARTLAAASEDLCFTDPTKAALLATEAVAIARRLDDPVTLGHVLMSYRVSANTPGNATARHAAADEIIDIGRKTGQPTFTMVGLYHRASCYRADGDLRASAAAIDATLALTAERSIPPTYLAAVTLFRATQHLLAGDLTASESVANEVWSLASDGFDPANWYGPAVLAVRYAQGRMQELLPLLEPAVAQPGIGDIYRAVLSIAYAHDDRQEEARRVLRHFADAGFAPVPRNFAWLASMLALAETAEFVRDGDAARSILDLLGPYAGMFGDMPQTVVGPVDLALAGVALTAGAVSVAEEAARRAVARSRERNTPIYLGRELVRLAAARQRSGGDPEDIANLVDEARKLAADYGAGLIIREAELYELA